ncbi:MAG: hypothetical protein Ct9H90mP13_00280 [Pseudomonadota bacterium]|nr:MAG: hypothetical protein Ct9H90mP13_00280 [Pseudomonadota bacterium]
MKKSYFLLFLWPTVRMLPSQQENNFNLTEQEVTSILNDDALSSVKKGQRYKIEERDIKHFLRAKAIRKEALPHGMAQTLMENRLLAGGV